LYRCICNYILKAKMKISKKLKEDSIIPSIGKTRRVIANAINKRIVEKGHDMTVEQIILLHNIGEKEGVKQQELADCVFKEKATITRALNKMEAKSVIVRIADKEDKRQKLIYLTHKGKELHELLLPILWEISDKATKGIEEKELKQCKSVLNKIFENLV